jgi:hypothetical protein
MTRSAALRYLAAFVVAVVVMAAAYVSVFVYQLGAPVAAEYWVYEAKHAKVFLATRAAGERIFILGGSNALFGIDSAMIEHALHRPTVNLAIHAGLPVRYLAHYAVPLLRPGDVVVMPLETEYYAAAAEYEWFRNNVMAWDPGYFWQLSWLEKAGFIGAVPPKRVVNGAIARINDRRLRRAHGRVVRKPAVLTDELEQIHRAGTYAPIAYSLRNLDAHGDTVNNRGAHFTGFGGSPWAGQFEYTPRVWRVLAAFAEACRRRDVQLFVTWPPLLWNVTLERSNPMLQWHADYIADRMRAMGIRVIGSPYDYVLDRTYFFDSVYHLNHEGRAIRTGQLVRDLEGPLAARPAPRHGSPSTAAATPR